MSAVRIGPKHQVTIPQPVREALHLSAGDLLDAAAEQRVLLRARAKIERIRKDLVRAKGLTREEAAVAAKVGLIEPDQRYWWTEQWQKGERAADADRGAGRLLGTFDPVDMLKGSLGRRGRASA